MATTASAPSQGAPEIQLNGSEPTSSETRAELRLNMFKKIRPYPLRHEWVFWHDRNASTATNADDKYEDHLKEIAQISTIQVILLQTSSRL